MKKTDTAARDITRQVTKNVPDHVWQAVTRVYASPDILPGEGTLKETDPDTGKTHLCLMGALCEAYLREHPNAAWLPKPYDHLFKDATGEVSKMGVPTQHVLTWAGLDLGDAQTLSCFNDMGFTPATIISWAQKDV